jgi:hypothetical protein
MKDKNGKQINEGDTIDVSGLRTIVLCLSELYGNEMVGTEYGDFNASLVEVV